jgi:AcrR family transcriptional regulator
MGRQLPFKERNAPETRARILRAAQRAFSEAGYSHIGIREIAQMAGTSPTLLARYFGSKLGLFEAALIAAMPMGEVIAEPRGAFGERMARALMDPKSEIRPPMMIALASGDPEAAAVAARVTETHAIAPLAKWLGGREARARALAISMAATGFVTYLRQVPLQAPTARERTRLAKWFAATVQALVDG